MSKKIGLIIGSTRPSRISPSIAKWLQVRVTQPDLPVDLLDLATIDLPFLKDPAMPADHQYTLDSTKRWSEQVQGYDAFILLFPQYNWGYPAPLKNALDTLYQEWRGKPVSLVSYGNHGGFQAALGMQLVVRGLKMPLLTNNLQISLEKSWFDDQSQFTDVDLALTPYAAEARQLGAELRRRLV
ncbi:MAG: NAD(P)H-dependent oxidoreductase [Levilactobacillus sp.]|jgi:NAD(P)H-dependent FMN reductase|uniref:NADPH-dependent FMN reductase n=1 Tax=Levilactobacillus sp. TaxID=2767919 RepID=UPI00258F8FCE|nr:NADPH-dependent FMN reductase [Levilactobacillus sp.]MCI1553496.1 NAD(P)H-dependent oxidoreductase [Levilactobacillus sp.]MCI1597885.1 NAD(P)H-dependent oxidoreductase [Levilactobacillus sp.]MCI1606224.1 NAD(P)H-dependent oxidoreductase [Levilactobacillus sp.]